MADLTPPRRFLQVDIEEVAAIVHDVAREEILPRWRGLAEHEIIQKSGPRDLVTVADQAAEAALARRLTSEYPGTYVVGEETVARSPDRLSLLRSAAPVWVIDPIDGTYAFAHGEPEFGVMLALVQAGELLAAWIHEPVDGGMTLGERGASVQHVATDGSRTTSLRANDRPVPEMTGIVSGGIVLEPGGSVIRAEKARHFRDLRHHACPARDYPRVLRGEADFAAYSKCLPWDHLAGAMLLSEAGYVVAKFDGSPYAVGDMTGGVLCAQSRRAWEEIRERLSRSEGRSPARVTERQQPE